MQPMYNSQDMEEYWMLADGWIRKKKCVRDTQWSTIQSKNESNPAICDNRERDLEPIMVSEINQIEKDKYHRISLTCGI